MSTDIGAEPPLRCPSHQTAPAAGPCAACGDAKAWHAEWSRRAAQAASEARSAAAHDRARTTRLSIRTCPDCDDHGYTPAGRLCNHDPQQDAINARGVAAARAALAAAHRPTGDTP
jgi:hypothetical protein